MSSSTIAGRAYLYSIDFPGFRGRAVNSMRAVNQFHIQRVCCRSRFAAVIRLYINDKFTLLLTTIRKPGAKAADSDLPILLPLTLNPGDELYITVTDDEPRWFRWFRLNKACVVLEGTEVA